MGKRLVYIIARPACGNARTSFSRTPLRVTVTRTTLPPIQGPGAERGRESCARAGYQGDCASDHGNGAECFGNCVISRRDGGRATASATAILSPARS